MQNNNEHTQLQHLTAVTVSIHNYLLAYIHNTLEDAIRSSTTKHQRMGKSAQEASKTQSGVPSQHLCVQT